MSRDLPIPPKQPGRPRIAILADLPRNALGGLSNGRGAGHAATWLPQLADALGEAADLEFVWLTLDAAANGVECVPQSNQWFIRVPASKMTFDILTGHRLSGTRLARILRALAPDLIHAWGTERSYPSVLGLRDIPSVLSMQGILTEYRRRGTLPAGWRWRRQAGYEKPWVAAAKVVTTESEWGRRQIHKFCPAADVRLVEYGVHPSFYEVKWTPDPAKPVAFFCGSIDSRKGVDLLVEAMRLAGPPAWECWLAGGGPMTEEVAAMNLPGLRLLGDLDWRQLRECMAQAWCLVLPTRADTSPNAVKEARVVGMPVITSRHGGQAGYIMDGCNGMIVEPLDARSLRTAMDTMLGDFELARRMGQTRLQEDRDYLHPSRTAAGFLEIYREIVIPGAGGGKRLPEPPGC